MKIIISLVCFNLFALTLPAQNTSAALYLRLGYSATNIVIREAIVPDVTLFGYVFDPGKTFAGNGPELGVCKTINDKWFVDFAFSTFSGNETKAKFGNDQNFYTLKGFQLPVTINYLTRSNAKRWRINLGAGVQYMQAHLKQFETTTNTGGIQTTHQRTDISISEAQLVFRPGIQYRLIPNLFLSFILNASLSPAGRYADHPCFFLRYNFKK
jgi:hypothetical protein